jgi:hypothetical protein
LTHIPQHERIDALVAEAEVRLPKDEPPSRVEGDMARAAVYVAACVGQYKPHTTEGFWRAHLFGMKWERQDVRRYAAALVRLAPSYILIALDISSQSRTVYVLTRPEDDGS